MGTNKQTDMRIEAELGLDFDTFMNTVAFGARAEVRSFFFAPDSERKRIMDKLLGLGVFAGYEQNVNDTRLIVQLGYTLLRTEVEGQIPRFYQRLGAKHHVFGDWFFGLNVRFQYFGTADNLEWNIESGTVDQILAGLITPF